MQKRKVDSADLSPAPATGGKHGLLAYSLLGLAAGFASALFGIGGGLVLVPSLTIFFGLGIKEAVGTSLAGIIPISAVGLATEAITYGENIFWGTALLITCGSLLGARLGSIIVRRIQARHLQVIFAIFILLAAVRMFGLPAFGEKGEGLSYGEHGLFFVLSTVGTGLFAGICSVLFGVGGGVIVVPFLTFFFAGFDFHEARATSLAVILPTSIAGALLHGKMKNVRWHAVKGIVPLALVSAVAGVFAANILTAPFLKRVFAVLLVISSVKLFRRKK